MQDKTTRWAFTAYEDQFPLFATIPPIVAEWGWQPEVCPKTARLHYQGYIRTIRQVRFAQMKQVLPGVHIEQARNWNALLEYCKKDKTKAGAEVHQVNESKAMSMAQALTRIASYVPPLVYKVGLDESELNTVRYWKGVKELLRLNPNAVGLYTQPQYLRAWNNTYEIWEDLAATEVEYEIDDRQTDIPEEYAFLEERPRFTKKIVTSSIDATSPTEVCAPPSAPQCTTPSSDAEEYDSK